MQLEEIAHDILFAGDLEKKLAFDENFDDTPRRPALADVPRFPGRPAALSRLGKAEFPGINGLGEPSAHGRLLHFFANHELLALELMALMLLKFPEAPAPFRAGIARTMRDEQNHLRLYVGRMQQLGVGFGDLPVSDYFWNAMKGMTSPLQFVVQMSLTLEQANLDYSLFYQRAVAEAGDAATAAILDRVYREEIGHVKHGVTWFNRWRAPSSPDDTTTTEDDWDAYVRLLPAPMTPRRAKGPVFCGDPRREAGLSERFIRELGVFGGSRGRPPVFWIYNPLCDAEIARDRPGYTPAAPVRRLGLDLECLPAYLALDTDVVLVDELPRTAWLEEMRALGFRMPEFRLKEPRALPRETKISGLEPWGWSPDPFARFQTWRERLIPADGANGGWCRDLLAHESFASTGLGEIFSKAWSAKFLHGWLERHPEAHAALGSPETAGEVYTSWSAARDRLRRSFADGRRLVAKAPWGTSGTQNKRVLEESELESTLGGWIRRTIEAQGAIVLEPWLDNRADLSMQIEIGQTKTRVIGIRRFVNGPRLEYRGTYLDAGLKTLPTEILRFLHAAPSPLERWRDLARDLGEALRERGYRGPAGIDALVWRDADRLLLKPLVELNPRWTMGRVALALEESLAPGVPGIWAFVPVRELPARGLPADPAEAARALRERHPVRLQAAGSSTRIAEGVVLTTDPERAREVLTVLAAGSGTRFLFS